MTKRGEYVPIGVVCDKNTVGIFTKVRKALRPQFFIVWNKDNLHFKVTAQEVIIHLPNGRKENPDLCDNFKFSETEQGFVATYIRTDPNGAKHLVIAFGLTVYEFAVETTIHVEHNGSVLLEHQFDANKYLLYLDGLFMRLARSKTLKQWHREPTLLLTSRPGRFDRGELSLMGGVKVKKGILIFYDASEHDEKTYKLRVGAALFSNDNPMKAIWRSDTPLWSGLVHENFGSGLYPLGAIVKDRSVTFYWASKEGAIVSAYVALPFGTEVIVPKDRDYLIRSTKNPILGPKSQHTWESEAVFNPAAVYDDGKIHLFYRAIGESGISVLGYASSDDGINFNHRLNYPVLEPGEGYGTPDPMKDIGPKAYNPLMYASGGGWSGYEDPRAVKIGKKIYVTYLAFGGWDSMRIALTSISEKDLEHKKWKWSRPQFISPPGEVNKNWVLFPEKINGKFAILHSITPEILIHYVDSLQDFDGETFVKSRPPSGGRLEYWDNKVRGVGPPPVKTDLGWLVLYHANDMSEPYKYKLGAMILDIHDPKKVLYRTSHPILCPDMPYENDGKPGIVYASGAIVKDGKLFVYYGGGDKVVCVATAPLDKFLESIRLDKEFQFEPTKPITL